MSEAPSQHRDYDDTLSSMEFDALKELMWLHDEVAKCFLLLDMTKFTLPETLHEIKRAHRESTMRFMRRKGAKK